MASKKQNDTTEAETQDSGLISSGNDAGGDAAPGEHVFKLNKTNEINVRFKGDHELRYTLPTPVPGATVQQVLDGELPENVVETLRSIAARFAPEADFATVLVAKVNGQGLNLDVQKAAKDFLAPGNEASKDLAVDEALAGATQAMAEYRAGAPRARSASAPAGKVAKAEAKAAAATSTALDMYRALTPEMRAQYRGQLIALGAATAEELDAVDTAA